MSLRISYLGKLSYGTVFKMGLCAVRLNLGQHSSLRIGIGMALSIERINLCGVQGIFSLVMGDFIDRFYAGTIRQNLLYRSVFFILEGFSRWDAAAWRGHQLALHRCSEWIIGLYYPT